MLADFWQIQNQGCEGCALEKVFEQCNTQTGWVFTEMHFSYTCLMAYPNNNKK